MVSKINTAI